MQNIFFWEKTFYTKKKTHVFPNFSQRVMQNSENFPPEIFFPLCNSWGPHHGNEPQASRTCWERWKIWSHDFSATCHLQFSRS
jgi:hypothetical protein